MSIKLKAFGLGLLALLAMGAFAAANAAAEGGGHFTSDSPNGKTWITATESRAAVGGTGEHVTVLEVDGLGAIHCNHVLYEGTAPSNTVESLTITPTYKECTTVSNNQAVTVDHNGCNFTFTIAKKTTTLHNTVDVVCPAGKAIVITHPSCEITVAPQTLTGITYNTVVENNKHAITLVSEIGVNGTPKLTTQFHGGICTLLGTTHTGTFTGSVTVKGFEDKKENPIEEGPQVNITATGIE